MDRTRADQEHSTMKKAALSLVIGLIALTGCAHRYVIRLDNGTEITSASKPVLKEGSYSFKDAKGEEQFVGAGRVREVAPASVAAKENKAKPFKSEPPKKRKWYFLWLA
jgi:hypothetical protein